MFAPRRGRLLRWGGQFCLVFRTERLAELLETLRRSGLEPKRLRLVQHDAASAPSLLLLESRRGGRPGLAVEPTLLLRDADGRETDETRRIYFRDKEVIRMAGIIYLVATPIGNLGDFSPRAVETLRSADFIAAEDTRVSMKLLNHLRSKSRS